MTDNDKIKLFDNILKKLFFYLNKENVVYAVYPYKKNSDLLNKDLDIYTTDLRIFTRVIISFTKHYNEVDCYLIKDHTTGRRFNLLCRSNDGEYAVLPGPDIILFSSNKMSEVGDIKFYIDRAEIDGKGMKILRNEDAYFLYLIKSIEKCKFDLPVKEYLKELQMNHETQVLDRLNTVFGNQSAHIIYKQSIEKFDTSDDFKIKLISHQINKKENLRMTKYKWAIFRIIKRILQPSGLFIVFLGPDGSGKTSAINQSLPKIKKLLATNRHNIFHLRISSLKNNLQKKSVDDPHRLQPRNFLISTIKVFYFLFSYFISYIFIVRPLLVRSTLVIFDRYYHDLLIDTKRYRYGGSLTFAKLISKLIPKPDLVILLDAPAKVIQARKQEVSYAESARQRDAYYKLVKSLKNGTIVDASAPLQDVTTEIEHKIVSFLVNRSKK